MGYLLTEERHGDTVPETGLEDPPAPHQHGVRAGR